MRCGDAINASASACDPNVRHYSCRLKISLVLLVLFFLVVVVTVSRRSCHCCLQNFNDDFRMRCVTQVSENATMTVFALKTAAFPDTLRPSTLSSSS
jgi:hypothetical protein